MTTHYDVRPLSFATTKTRHAKVKQEPQSSDLLSSQSTSGCKHHHIHGPASIVEVGRHTRRTKIHERRKSRSSRQTETRGSQVGAGEGEEMSRKKSYPWFWRPYLYSPAMVSLNSASGIMSLFSTKLNYREIPRIRYVSGDARTRDRPATHLGDKQIKVSVIRVQMRYSQTFRVSISLRTRPNTISKLRLGEKDSPSIPKAQI